jgi:GxxExxY protein
MDSELNNTDAALTLGRKGAVGILGEQLLHRTVTERVLGCFFEVYWALGPGFLESVYGSALAIEFERRGLAARREVALDVFYRRQNVGSFRADFVVEGTVLLELKTAERLTEAHGTQTVNYLHATGIEVGLLLNFGPRPVFRRFVLTQKTKPAVNKQQL